MTVSPTPTTRITATPAAREAVSALRAARGAPVMFVQSGGCCAGSTPMCFADGEFITGDVDILLGDIDGSPFYIDKRLDEAWHQDPSALAMIATNVILGSDEPTIAELPAHDGRVCGC